PVVVNLEARQAIHVDHARVQELSLHAVWKLTRVEELAAYRGPHAFVVEYRVDTRPPGELFAAERRIPMLLSAGAVAADALPPPVEHVAPRVAVARRVEV